MFIHREIGSKYGNSVVHGIRGYTYRSKAERDHALWLEAERRSGRVKAWEYEKSYDLTAGDPFPGDSIKAGERVGDGGIKLIGRHKPDFTITLPDGRIEVHEVKGGQATKTEAWGLRKKLFEANYPHIRYRVFEFGSERRARVIRWDC